MIVTYLKRSWNENYKSGTHSLARYQVFPWIFVYIIYKGGSLVQEGVNEWFLYEVTHENEQKHLFQFPLKSWRPMISKEKYSLDLLNLKLRLVWMTFDLTIKYEIKSEVEINCFTPWNLTIKKAFSILWHQIKTNYISEWLCNYSNVFLKTISNTFFVYACL